MDEQRPDRDARAVAEELYPKQVCDADWDQAYETVCLLKDMEGRPVWSADDDLAVARQWRDIMNSRLEDLTEAPGQA